MAVLMRASWSSSTSCGRRLGVSKSLARRYIGPVGGDDRFDVLLLGGSVLYQTAKELERRLEESLELLKRREGSRRPWPSLKTPRNRDRELSRAKGAGWTRGYIWPNFIANMGASLKPEQYKRSCGACCAMRIPIFEYSVSSSSWN